MVVTTHFLELFEYGLIAPVVDLRVLKYRMDYLLPEDALPLTGSGDEHHVSDDELVPLFKLVPGVATSSDGLACAKLGGLPAPLLDRAREIMELLEQGKPITAVAAAGDASGAQALGPGSVGRDILDLFLATPSFASADGALLAKFKGLVTAL